MKTISGKVVTTAPISLSKAAKVIANFASFDNGASEAVSVYLRRSSDAFDALVQFHKDLKASHSTARKHKRHHPSADHQQDNGYSSAVKCEDEAKTGQFVDTKNSIKRESFEGRVKKEKLDDGEVKMERDVVRLVEGSIKDEKEAEGDDGAVKKRDKKKRKKNEGEEGIEATENENKVKSGEEGFDSAERSGKKRKKRRKIDGKD